MTIKCISSKCGIQWSFWPGPGKGVGRVEELVGQIWTRGYLEVTFCTPTTFWLPESELARPIFDQTGSKECWVSGGGGSLEHSHLAQICMVHG